MANLESIRQDTLYFTGWNYLASSCWMKIQQVDISRDQDDPFRNRELPKSCTNRNGLFARVDSLVGWSTDKFRIPQKLNTDVQLLGELMERLTNIWLWPSGYDSRQARLLQVLPNVHYYSYTGRHRFDRAPVTRLFLGVPYRVWFDWAYPYSLVPEEDESTRLYPFGDLDSKIGSRKVDGKWNRPRLVRFKKAGDFDQSGLYETEILDASGKVVSKIKPPKVKPSEPKWMQFRPPEHEWMQDDPEAKKPRPRLIMPHTDGFLLLHKYFMVLLEAYNLLRAYQLTISNFQRDMHLLDQVDHMLELSGRSNDPKSPEDADTLPQIKEGFELISIFKGEAKSMAEQTEKLMVQLKPPFKWLIHFHKSDAYKKANKDWYRFDNFLGPLTFFELGAWVIRQSPFAEEFYDLYGKDMIKPVGKTWPGVRDQEKDTMLTDPRFQGKETIEAVDASLAWAKRSVKIYTSVNQMYAYYHVTPIVKELAPLVDKVSADELKDFVTFLTDNPQAADFVDELEVMARKNPNAPPPGELQSKLKKIDFPGRKSLPIIGAGLDAFQRTVRLVTLAESLESHKWDQNAIMAVSRDVLGLANSAATLMGKSGKFVFKKVLGPVTAALDVWIYVDKSYQEFCLNDYYRGSMRGIQAIGAGLCLAAIYTAWVPVAGWLTSTVLVVIGTLLIVAAELALWIEKKFFVSDWEEHARNLYGGVLMDVREWHYDVDVRRRSINVGPFGKLLGRYNGMKKKWNERTIGPYNHSFEWVLEDNDTWDEFPEFRWRYLERNETEHKQKYIEYCQELAKKRGQTWSPGPGKLLPPPPDLPYPRP
jgi:hypothetical protein